MDIFVLHLNRLLEDNLEFKTELRVVVIKDEDLAEVEFHNTLTPTGRMSLLCKFHLPIQNIPRVVSITVAPRLTATSVIRSSRYYGHFFWPPGKNRRTFLAKNPR